MTGRTELRDGRVVTPDAVLDGGRVVLEGDRVAQVDPAGADPLPSARTVDASDRVVLPGLVDLHGDDVETHRAPRHGDSVDVRTALTVADRTNLLAGVTTKFHAVAFEESPSEDRSIAAACELARAIATATDTLGDSRLHARCELSEESVATVERIADGVGVDLVSVMHHAPDGAQFDRESFQRHYAENRNWSTDHVAEAAAQRELLSGPDLDSLAGRVADVAAQAGVPLASHDDETPADVDRMSAHGATLSEYPVTEAAARHATEQGLTTAMGAPNVVRGGSLWDNLSARAAIDEGLVDVLCADYRPQSLLAAPFVDTGESLPTRVNRVTRNPAAAMGLDDRGRIEVGARADLVVVDADHPPTVERVFVGGREVLRAGADRR
jgi:alpha-D-ribose 1-methylphosphonate 5-triphosphate diphosphatase